MERIFLFEAYTVIAVGIRRNGRRTSSIRSQYLRWLTLIVRGRLLIGFSSVRMVQGYYSRSRQVRSLHRLVLLN